MLQITELFVGYVASLHFEVVSYVLGYAVLYLPPVISLGMRLPATSFLIYSNHIERIPIRETHELPKTGFRSKSAKIFDVIQVMGVVSPEYIDVEWDENA